MYRGDAQSLRRKEQQAAALAAEVAALLNQIEALGVGQATPTGGRIAGPGFEIRRTDARWTVRA
ncbi:hypothetical protein [Streptomyces sp. NPDC049744]|uniref:hypothetical protein n=1 Tax=Streptomyces sp. NPDC049744 TaxID=3154359 RepID=UPI00344AACAE